MDISAVDSIIHPKSGKEINLSVVDQKLEALSKSL
jgi:hypothetical protein